MVVVDYMGWWLFIVKPNLERKEKRGVC